MTQPDAIAVGSGRYHSAFDFDKRHSPKLFAFICLFEYVALAREF